MSNVGEQEEKLGLSSGLLLHQASRLADVMDEGVRDVVQHGLHGGAVVQRLHSGRAEGEGTWGEGDKERERVFYYLVSITSS